MQENGTQRPTILRVKRRRDSDSDPSIVVSRKRARVLNDDEQNNDVEHILYSRVGILSQQSENWEEDVTEALKSLKDVESPAAISCKQSNASSSSSSSCGDEPVYQVVLHDPIVAQDRMSQHFNIVNMERKAKLKPPPEIHQFIGKSNDGGNDENEEEARLHKLREYQNDLLKQYYHLEKPTLQEMLAEKALSTTQSSSKTTDEIDDDNEEEVEDSEYVYDIYARNPESHQQQTALTSFNFPIVVFPDNNKEEEEANTNFFLPEHVFMNAPRSGSGVRSELENEEDSDSNAEDNPNYDYPENDDDDYGDEYEYDDNNDNDDDDPFRDEYDRYSNDGYSDYFENSGDGFNRNSFVGFNLGGDDGDNNNGGGGGIPTSVQDHQDSMDLG